VLIRKFHADITPPATAVVRNDAGNQNPVALIPVGTPVLAETFRFLAAAAEPTDVGVFLFGYASPAELATPWGVLLCDLTDPGGELLATAGLGGPHFFANGYVAIATPLPTDTTMCGFDFCTQAVEIGADLSLTNAVDLTLGMR